MVLAGVLFIVPKNPINKKMVFMLKVVVW